MRCLEDRLVWDAFELGGCMGTKTHLPNLLSHWKNPLSTLNWEPLTSVVIHATPENQSLPEAAKTKMSMSLAIS